MNKSVLVLAPLAAAAIAACTTNEPVTPAPAPVVIAPQPAPPAQVAVVPGTAAAGGSMVVVPANPGALRVGAGRVDSIVTVPNASSDMRRVGVKMNDGSVQYVDGRVPNLSIGDRVEITSDGHLRYPAP
jgi:hypothetical protein